MKRVGFLMGSFDPIHTGHINIITNVLNNNVVDKVVIVPSGHNPWKKADPLPLKDRVELCRLAIAPFASDAVEVSDIEGTFEPPFFSNKPLNHFRLNEYKDCELFIIAGTDTVERIPRWKNFETDISPYYRIIEFVRPLYKPSTVTSTIKGKTECIGVNPIGISSTEIREMVANGKEIYPMVPAAVRDCILKNKFYTLNK